MKAYLFSFALFAAAAVLPHCAVVGDLGAHDARDDSTAANGPDGDASPDDRGDTTLDSMRPIEDVGPTTRDDGSARPDASGPDSALIPDSNDGSPPNDATANQDADSFLDGGDLAAPRPIAPLSGSRTAAQPTFAWVLATGTDGAVVEVFRDRACTMFEQSIVAAGTHVDAPTALTVGAHYWRLRGKLGTRVGVAAGPVWQLTIPVGHVPPGANANTNTAVDVNGDGLADLVVGDPNATGGIGRVMVFFGRTAGLGSSADQTIAGVDGANTFFGRAVYSAGDVNGDGFTDIAVGAQMGSRVDVFFGSSSGLAGVPSVSLAGPPPHLYTAIKVGSADVNGDGFSDLAIGFPDVMRAPEHEDRVDLYFGSAVGLASTPSSTFTDSFYLSNARTIGFNVARAGDVNGDGYEDLALYGDWLHLFWGGPTGVSTMPFNVGILGTGNSDAQFARLGDANSDGYADFALGEPFGVSYANNSGRVDVCNGSPTAPRFDIGFVDPSGGQTSFGNAVVTSDFNGDGLTDVAVANYSLRRLYVYLAPFHSDQPVVVMDTMTGSDFGMTASTVGDLNGDGYDDVIVGTRQSTLDTEGNVKLFYGGPQGLGATPSATLSGFDGTSLAIAN